MRMLSVAASITILALALGGCASSGPAIEDAKLTGLQPGRTTADEVIRRLGQPSFNSNNLDGTRTIAYLEPGNRSDSSAMVTLIGAIASGAKPNVNSVIFRFDANGRLSETIRTTESVSEAAPGRVGTITINQPPASATPTAPGKPAATSAPAPSPATAATPAATGTPAAARAPTATTTTTAPAAKAAPARPAPKRQTREDGLPDWLPSGNYDPRKPF